MKINIFVKVSKKSFTMGWCGVVRLSVRLSVLAWLFFWEHLEFRNLANVSLGTLPGGFFQKNFKNLKMGFLFFFLKIQDDHGRSKVQNRPNFTPQITFFVITWIRFIGFRQNLAWTFYLTPGTSPRKNFSFFSKSKMAAGGQRSKIGQIGQSKSHFGPGFRSGSSNLNKMRHRHTTWA